MEGIRFAGGKDCDGGLTVQCILRCFANTIQLSVDERLSAGNDFMKLSICGTLRVKVTRCRSCLEVCFAIVFEQSLQTTRFSVKPSSEAGRKYSSMP
jgi:hypothetical protein